MSKAGSRKKSTREREADMARALAGEFGGKPAEHSHGFSWHGKFEGYKCGFGVHLGGCGVGMQFVRYQAPELRGLGEGALIFSDKEVDTRFGKARVIKGALEGMKATARRSKGTEHVSDEFVNDFCFGHREKIKALELAGEDYMHISGRSVAMRLESMDAESAIERFKALKVFVRAISEGPKEERQLFEKEWLLQEVKGSGKHRFGGKMEPLVDCPRCGGPTNLMAEIDLGDSALPKTKLGRGRLPLFWCLRCLEWDAVFYDVSGAVARPLNAKGKLVEKKKVVWGGGRFAVAACEIGGGCVGEKGRKEKQGGRDAQMDSNGD